MDKVPGSFIFEKEWPYVGGAVILALLNILLFMTTAKAWSITTPLTYMGAWLYQGLGGQPAAWEFFTERASNASIGSGLLLDSGVWLVIMTILGAGLSALSASQWRWRKPKSKRQILLALSGGLLMGYGSRLANGCNIGAMVGGVSSSSLQGWLVMLFIFIGAWAGVKLMVKILK